MSKAGSELGSAVSIHEMPPSSVASSLNRPKTELSGASFFILLPEVSAEQRAQYGPPRGSSLLPSIDEVIGEYTENGIRFYFARFKGGIAHRYREISFKDHFLDLVETYDHKKVNGTLEPFDPTASYVHPLDRAKSTPLDLASSRATSSFTPISSLTDDEEYSDGDEEGDESLNQRRQSLRNRKSRQLPFSPKKTKRVVLKLSADSDEDLSDRRTVRSKQLRLKPVAYNEDEYGESEVDDESEVTSESDYRGGRWGTKKRSKGKGKQKAKPRGPRPEYGSIRPISDIELDYFSDDEDRHLRAHRQMCEKCHHAPAHIQLKSRKRGRQRKKDPDNEETDEEERIRQRGGWVRCLKCPVSAHWGCLAQTQRDEVLKAIRQRDVAKWQEEHVSEDNSIGPPRRKEIDTQETTDFICGGCSKGGICMGCLETVLEPLTDAKPLVNGEDVVMVDPAEGATVVENGNSKDTPSRELLYRCLTCKRLAHYAHLRRPPSMAEADLPEIAEYYQTNTTWLCPDCTSYRYPLDKIIAWRPYPPDAAEPSRPRDQPPPYKDRLPREYLVKWQDRSYRRLSWVPHMWLVSTNPSKLKNFLAGGTKVQLLEEPVDDDEHAGPSKEQTPAFNIGTDGSRASSVKPGAVTPKLPNDALPDAERWIPPAWKTVDRVLDVVLWIPDRMNMKHKSQKRSHQIITSDDEGEEAEANRMIFEQGELPSLDNTETAEEWEERTGRTITVAEIDKVVWAFIKWDDLGYDEASWDSPPLPGEKHYDAYKNAFERFVFSRTVEIPKLSKEHTKRFDARAKDEYRRKHLLKDAADLQLGQAPNLKLMPFQVDGFNWLCNNWWNHQQCILADEMGLGKTVQVTTFLGFIASQWKAYPALVVVPNSTITNWVREFERWAPGLRVVPFYGDKKARDVIRKFELFHQRHHKTSNPAKFHVLVTTYETITGRDFTPVFKNQNRWEVLIVDEGQRLKSDSSLLFRKLNELNSIHRVIMTGTPLNNNIRELFNLMNFLNPKEWADLEGLEKEYAELDEESIKSLHVRLRPYFLRRIKSEVLQLPAKNEVIVPVSMTPLQKEVSRSILSHNLDILNGLRTKSFGLVNKGKLNNILMHLRKCLQHPYLYSEDIEPKGLSNQEAHEKLIDASCKLRFLKSLLPMLKERGHRVLLFSQFVIALDIIEDFLVGEGHKYLRLDGNTKGSERQKGMDEFNRPGSDIFVYLLTTRAGGVGINLFSADTVIIFDPDFNPHQDLQAIARAYRYGQKKTCLVFKLMVKASAEEHIMKIGKKKLVLDHLIVQKMDDGEDGAGEDIQSILTYGAQALFSEEGQNSRDIIYSDQDILKLIEKTEVEGEQEDKPKEGMKFSFAKIWAAEKDTLEEIEDNDPVDSWAQTLQKIEAERAAEVGKVQAESGRGRRKAATLAKKKLNNEVLEGPEPSKVKKGKKPAKSDASGSAYSVSQDEESSERDSDIVMENDPLEANSGELQLIQHSNFTNNNFHVEPEPQLSAPYSKCGLCGEWHDGGLGQCAMTDNSANLAEYREILILHADDEDWNTRSAAIRAIDEVLHSRGHLSLIAGQPLHPIRSQPPPLQPLVPKQPPVLDRPRPTQAPPAQLNETHNSSQAHNKVPQMPMGTASQATLNSGPSQPVVGPSKRPYPSSDEPAKKKQKFPSDLQCVVCGSSPVHLVKECRVVREGSKSISQQIERLERDSNMKDTVDILRKVLRRVKIREMEAEMAQKNP